MIVVACGCDPRGSVDLQCDSRTGLCQCKDRVVGAKCGRCSLGTQNLSSGCVGKLYPCILSSFLVL